MLEVMEKAFLIVRQVPSRFFSDGLVQILEVKVGYSLDGVEKLLLFLEFTFGDG